MKTFLAVLLLLGSTMAQYVPMVPATPTSGGGGASVTLISATNCGGGFTNSFTCALTQNAPVGSRVVAAVYSNTSMATLTPSISDPSSNTWSTCVQNNINTSAMAWAFCDAVITSQINSAANITVSIPGSGGSNGAGVYLFLLSSHTGASGADTSGVAAGNSGTASATTLANLSATDFVLACGSVDNTNTLGAFTTAYTMLVTNATPVNSYPKLNGCGWKTQVSGATASVSSALGTGSPNFAISVLGYKQ